MVLNILILQNILVQKFNGKINDFYHEAKQMAEEDSVNQSEQTQRMRLF